LGGGNFEAVCFKGSACRIGSKDLTGGENVRITGMGANVRCAEFPTLCPAIAGAIAIRKRTAIPSAFFMALV